MILEEVTSCKKCTCKLMLFPPPPPLPPSTYRSSISTRLDTCAHVYFRRLHMFPKQKSLMFDGVLFKILWITMPYLFEVNRRAKSHHLMISNTLFDWLYYSSYILYCTYWLYFINLQGWHDGLYYLLAKGANCLIADNCGRLPLHAATYFSNE